jgi:hypothetical protein
VTITFFCFFCIAHLASKITRFCSYFYQYRHDINKNMIPLAPPSQEGMGEAFLAPQGAAPAPPLQEGMGEASLAPQGAAPAPPSQKGMGDASLAPQGAAPAPPSHEGMGEASLVPQGAAPAPPLKGGGGEGLPGAPGHDVYRSRRIIRSTSSTFLPHAHPIIHLDAIVFGCSGGRRRSNAAAAVTTTTPLTAANRINNQQTTQSGGAGYFTGFY